jgi:hypothetical protein
MASERSFANLGWCHILDCDMEMVQQSNEPLHPYPLEFLVINELYGAYDEPYCNLEENGPRL